MPFARQKCRPCVGNDTTQKFGGMDGNINVRLTLPDIDPRLHACRVKSPFLVDQDIIPRNTLRTWAKTFPDRTDKYL